MMEDTRHRTLQAVDGLPTEHIDLIPNGGDNSVGSLLYHVAAIEVDWLYADILRQPYPGWMSRLFPDDVRTDDGELTAAGGSSLDGQIARLAAVRQHLLEDIAVVPPRSSCDLAGSRAERSPPSGCSIILAGTKPNTVVRSR